MSKSNNNGSLKDQLCAIRENLKQFRNEIKSYNLASLLENDNLQFQSDTKKNAKAVNQKLSSTPSLRSSLSEASENNNNNLVKQDDQKSKNVNQSESSKKSDISDIDQILLSSEVSTSSNKNSKSNKNVTNKKKIPSIAGSSSTSPRLKSIYTDSSDEDASKSFPIREKNEPTKEAKASMKGSYLLSNSDDYTPPRSSPFPISPPKKTNPPSNSPSDSINRRIVKKKKKNSTKSETTQTNNSAISESSLISGSNSPKNSSPMLQSRNIDSNHDSANSKSSKASKTKSDVMNDSDEEKEKKKKEILKALKLANNYERRKKRNSTGRGHDQREGVNSVSSPNLDSSSSAHSKSSSISSARKKQQNKTNNANMDSSNDDKRRKQSSSNHTQKSKQSDLSASDAKLYSSSSNTGKRTKKNRLTVDTTKDENQQSPPISPTRQSTFSPRDMEKYKVKSFLDSETYRDDVNMNPETMLKDTLCDLELTSDSDESIVFVPPVPDEMPFPRSPLRKRHHIHKENGEEEEIEHSYYDDDDDDVQIKEGLSDNKKPIDGPSDVELSDDLLNDDVHDLDDDDLVLNINDSLKDKKSSKKQNDKNEDIDNLNDDHSNDELDVQFNIESPSDQDLNEKAKKRNQDELNNREEDKDFTLVDNKDDNNDGEVKFNINTDELDFPNSQGEISLGDDLNDFNPSDISDIDLPEEEEELLSNADLNQEMLTRDAEINDEIFNGGPQKEDDIPKEDDVDIQFLDDLPDEPQEQQIPEPEQQNAAQEQQDQPPQQEQPKQSEPQDHNSEPELPSDVQNELAGNDEEDILDLINADDLDVEDENVDIDTLLNSEQADPPTPASPTQVNGEKQEIDIAINLNFNSNQPPSSSAVESNPADSSLITKLADGYPNVNSEELDAKINQLAENPE